MTPQPGPDTTRSGRIGPTGLTPEAVRRKALTRLTERVDLSRSRFKPISLLRHEARRVLDTFLDLEVPHWPKADRDRLADEVAAEALGLGPLDELFRDEATQEFMVLAYNRVIARRGDAWLPTSVHFKDPDHYRQAVARLAEQGEPMCPGVQPAGATDARLPNGFRMVAVQPPVVLDQPPVAVFVRLPAPAPAPGAASSGVVPLGGARSSPDVAPSGASTAKLRLAPPPAPSASRAVAVPPSRGSSGVAPPSPLRTADPLLWARERVTDRLSKSLAAAGIYDIGRVPAAELHKVVVLLVAEVSEQEKLGFTAPVCDRLALEILAGMRH